MISVPSIRPVYDLRDHFAEITKAVDYIAMTLEAPKAEALLNELDRTVRQIAEFPYSCEL